MSQAPADGDPVEWPSVSVVIPTVNRVEELARAVRSVLDQDYPGFVECIVVFDGTVPTTPDVPVPDNRELRLAVNSRTKGLAGNRNSGLDLALGDYVAHCDDDDEWLPGKLKHQVRLARQRPDASLVTTGLLIDYRDEQLVRLAPSVEIDLTELLRDRHMELHPSSFLVDRKRFLTEIGPVDEAIPGGYAEDYEWLLRAARVGPVVNVLEPLTKVYWHDSSFFVSHWGTIIEALEYLLRHYPDFHQVPRGLARIEGQLAFAHASLGHRREGTRLAVVALRRSRRAKQAYAALAVASGVVSSDRVLAMARARGRGI